MIDRREFLRASSRAALAAAALTACGSGSTATVASGDALFRAGRFPEADRAYADVLSREPKNVHALTQRGYVALLSNRLQDARRLLGQSLTLLPGDQRATQLLALTLYRADDFAQAARLGYQAPLLAGFEGTPYDIQGPDSSRVPLLQVRPVLLVDLAVNGLDPAPFAVDTGSGTVAVDADLAGRAGLSLIDAAAGGRAVVTGGRQVTPGKLARIDRVRIGDFEVRGVPGGTLPGLPDGTSMLAGVRAPDGRPVQGVVGTTFLGHFLATLDYPAAVMVLRRRTQAQLRQVEREAKAADAAEVPFWIHTDHLIDAPANVNGRGPLLVTVDTGARPDYGAVGFLPTDPTIERLGITVDRGRGAPFTGSGGQSIAYPIQLDEVALGGAVERSVPGAAGVWPSAQLQAPGAVEPVVAGAVSGGFLSSFSLTIDTIGMRLFLARGRGVSEAPDRSD